MVHLVAFLLTETDWCGRVIVLMPGMNTRLVSNKKESVNLANIDEGGGSMVPVVGTGGQRVSC